MTQRLKYLCIVIPMFNEEKGAQKCVETVVPILQTLSAPTILCVVNDGSSDRTLEILNSLKKSYPFHLANHEKNRGYGKALMTGVKEAKNLGCDYVLFMDSDLTNDPRLIPLFIDKINEGYDLVKASRYIPNGKVDGVPFLKYIISRIGNRMASFFFDMDLHDCTNGFRAVKVDALEKLTLVENKFPLIMEELYYLKKQGIRVAEIPYVLTSRNDGEKKSSFTYTPKVFWSYLKYPIKSILKQYAELGPNNARMLYDFFSVLGSFFFYFLLMLLFNEKRDFSSFYFFSSALIFLVINGLFGLYGRHGKSSSLIKTGIILISASISTLFLFIKYDFLFSSLIMSATVILTSLPRIFLSLSLQFTNEVLSPIIRTNLPTLIIGGADAHAWPICQKLVEEGKKVMILDSADLSDHYKKNFGDNVLYIKGKVSDIYDLTSAIGACSTVIIARAYNGGLEDEIKARRENLFLINSILAISSGLQINRLFFLSSCNLYDRSQPLITEASPLVVRSIQDHLYLDAEIEILSNIKISCITVLRLPVLRKDKSEEVTTVGAEDKCYYIEGETVANIIAKMVDAPSKVINREIFNIGKEEDHIKGPTPSSLASYSIDFSKIKKSISF